MESELFGYEKGAFTGATGTKQGLFEVADGGTLFIDEIGELALGLQAKLLRVLEDGTLRRVGSVKERRVHVRLIAATNRDLLQEVKDKRFREDLFYRINVLTIQLPPLRQRAGDLRLLVEHLTGPDWHLDPDVLPILERYSWPGNVRQLQNALDRAKILADDDRIRAENLPPEIVSSAANAARNRRQRCRFGHTHPRARSGNVSPTRQQQSPHRSGTRHRAAHAVSAPGEVQHLRHERGAAIDVSPIPTRWNSALQQVVKRRYGAIAVLTTIGIAIHLALHFGTSASAEQSLWPLWLVLLVGGAPLTWELFVKLLRGEFGSDLLAGVSIVTSVVLGEYLAGSFVVMMLSGGEALEAYAVRNASKALEALARRMPSIAHRRKDGQLIDVAISLVRIHDELVVYPHEVCPVDGTVVAGHSAMDESYLTGEPYMLSKTPGSSVLSGSVNGDGALTVRTDKLPIDSRYAKIVEVMRSSEQQRPRMRRLGDQLGTFYMPLAIAIAVVAWVVAGDPLRFLAVLVVATPCPLLIAIPVTIIGAISLAAQRGIIIRNPAALEQISDCRIAIFDKTGTLTYGQPQLVEIVSGEGFEASQVLALAASLERYSKHPLSGAILTAARDRELYLQEAESIGEEPGRGLRGRIAGRDVVITGRKGLNELDEAQAARLPPSQGGLECVVVIDGRYAGMLRFRDEPRGEGATFIAHLQPKHHFRRMLLVSGDRDSEVQYLADRVGISEVYASQSPEQKVDIVRRETANAKTVFLGDGINDAPALTAATVGIAFGQNSDVSSEAADAVIMESSLQKFDEFLHIGRRMRRIALQSAIGGMALEHCRNVGRRDGLLAAGGRRCAARDHRRGRRAERTAHGPADEAAHGFLGDTVTPPCRRPMLPPARAPRGVWLRSR